MRLSLIVITSFCCMFAHSANYDLKRTPPAAEAAAEEEDTPSIHKKCDIY